MKFYLGVTDPDWYFFQSKTLPEDVNFWQPRVSSGSFRAIHKGAPFLFKLKSPYNAIGGLGFFSAHAVQPITVAWDIFGKRNGFETLGEFKKKIAKIRKETEAYMFKDFHIGCIILTNPIFFAKDDWIDVSQNWDPSIVRGKTYNTEETSDLKLWNEVEAKLSKYRFFEQEARDDMSISAGMMDDVTDRYRSTILNRVRVGQGAFRINVTDAYQKRCAITGEHTLTVLEAAHIKPYSEDGPNRVSNGLLIRSDLHKLFDAGYITVTDDYHLEVSRALKEDYNNGKIYYSMHGQKLIQTPLEEQNRPNPDFIRWHNENIYRAG